jgi:hypothetical protein
MPILHHVLHVGLLMLCSSPLYRLVHLSNIHRPRLTPLVLEVEVEVHHIETNILVNEMN